MGSSFSEGELRLESVSRDRSLRDQASETLRAALITGRMRPGTVYPAPALAEMLGVSATPVREAMLDLAREGLVEVVRNKGFRVTTVTDRELDDLAEARLLLEVPVMGEIVRHLTPEMSARLEELREVAAALEQAALTEDLVRYIELDTEFHAEFLSLHGNREIVRTVRALRARTRLYGLERQARAGTLVDATREHTQMIETALAEDDAAIEALMRRHIEHVRTDWAAPNLERGLPPR